MVEPQSVMYAEMQHDLGSGFFDFLRFLQIFVYVLARCMLGVGLREKKLMLNLLFIAPLRFLKKPIYRYRIKRNSFVLILLLKDRPMSESTIVSSPVNTYARCEALVFTGDSVLGKKKTRRTPA